MTAEPVRSFHLFNTAADAITYRRANGTGGWIFEFADSGEAMLFPWQMTANAVSQCPFVARRSGRLIGAADS